MLDEQEVVGAEVLGDHAGGLPLAVQGIGRDHHALKVQFFQHGTEFRDLVRLRVHFPLGHGAALGDVERGQEVHLAAVRADGAAGSLAVGRGLRQQPGNDRPPRRCGGAALLPLVPGHLRQLIRGGGGHALQVAVKRLVERVRVDPAQDAPEGPGGRRPGSPGERVRAAAEDQQGVLRAAGRPFRDRRRGVVPGRGERADGQGQHELQRMPASRPLARVRDEHQPFPQAAAGLRTAGKDSRKGTGRGGDQGR